MVRRGNPRFKPVGQTSSAPMIMICAGSGIAPFRAFIEHRAEMLRHQPDDKPSAPALLYAGFRSPAHTPYAPELEAWQAAGVVDVRYAYSQGEPRQHVQDKIWADREEFWRLWEEGARVYVCGGRGVNHGVREVVRKIYKEQAERKNGAAMEEDVEAWWVEALRERYVVEVF